MNYPNLKLHFAKAGDELIPLCGRRMQRQMDFTQDQAQVTCQGCLKKLAEMKAKPKRR